MYNGFPLVQFFNKKGLEKNGGKFFFHDFKFMIETIENGLEPENAFAQWWVKLQKL